MLQHDRPELATLCERVVPGSRWTAWAPPSRECRQVAIGKDDVESLHARSIVEGPVGRALFHPQRDLSVQRRKVAETRIVCSGPLDCGVELFDDLVDGVCGLIDTDKKAWVDAGGRSPPGLPAIGFLCGAVLCQRLKHVAESRHVRLQ